MSNLQILLVLFGLAGLAHGQAFNGFINPVFLPRGLRNGRQYNLYGDSLIRGQGLDLRYDDFQRYPNQNYDSSSYPGGLRSRINGAYPEYLRYQNTIGQGSYFGGQLDRGQLLNALQIPVREQFVDRGQLLTGDQVYDRGQFLNAGSVLDRGQVLDGRQLGGQILDRGQVLSTPSPDIAVTVQSNGSA